MTWESWIICAPLWLQSGIALTFILLYHMKDRELEVQKNGLCARCSYPLSRMRARLDALELEFAEIRRLRGWRQVELNTLKRVL